MRLPISLIVSLIFLAGCVQPPASPMEKHARLAAAALFAGQNCAGYAGGYGAAKQMKKDANKNIVIARKLGATDAVLQKAKTDVQTAFSTQSAFTSHQEACNALVGSLAWHSD
jgi:hypothetical protein